MTSELYAIDGDSAACHLLLFLTVVVVLVMLRKSIHSVKNNAKDTVAKR